MRPAPPVPGLLLAIVSALAVAATAMALWAATTVPWLGVPLLRGESGIVLDAPAFGLPAGAGLTAIGAEDGPAMALDPVDLLAEPDGLPRYAQIEAFLARQDALFALLQRPQLA